MTQQPSLPSREHETRKASLRAREVTNLSLPPGHGKEDPQALLQEVVVASHVQQAGEEEDDLLHDKERAPSPSTSQHSMSSPTIHDESPPARHVRCCRVSRVSVADAPLWLSDGTPGPRWNNRLEDGMPW